MGTLPYGRRRSNPPCVVGKFVKQGDSTYFVDDMNNQTPANRVDFLQGQWGGRHDGVERLPRPWEYDAAGKVVVEGDMVAAMCLPSLVPRIVIIGAVRPASRDAFLRHGYGTAGFDADVIRHRAAVFDTDGQLSTERVDVIINAADRGSVDVRATNQAIIGVMPDTEDSTDSTCLDITSDRIDIVAGDVRAGSANASDPVALSSKVDANNERIASSIENIAIAVNALAPGTVTIIYGSVLTPREPTGAERLKAV